MAWTAEQTDLALRMRVSLTLALNGRRVEVPYLDAWLRDRLQAELEPLLKVDPGDIQVCRKERAEGDPRLTRWEAYWRPQVQTVEFWGWAQDGTRVKVTPDRLFEPIITHEPPTPPYNWTATSPSETLAVKQRVWRVNRWDPKRRVWICQAER